MKVLVIDIGGTHVKVASTDHLVPAKFQSGPDLTPEAMVEGVLGIAQDWEFDAITIGYPGPVRQDRPAMEPHNLGEGWVPFDYEGRLGKPVRFLNDAAMQALGGYQGGKMLFLGVGTGLGSALIVDGLVIALELAHLPYRKGRTYEEYIGLAGLQKRGKKRWRKSVLDVAERLSLAFVADYVLLGGGNAKLMKEVPEFIRQGANANAIAGGLALWKQAAERTGGAGTKNETVNAGQRAAAAAGTEAGAKAGTTRAAKKRVGRSG